jgi:hypothetical protein
MLELIRQGTSGEAEWEEVELRRIREHGSICEKMAAADGIVLAYPLYTDSMPGIVVKFLETLAGDHAATDVLRVRGTPVLYVVHSGFPDGIHTAHLVEVNKRVSEHLGLRNLGTIRKPGSEGVRFMPPFMLRKVARTLERVGEALVTDQDMTSTGAESLVRFERYPLFRRIMVRLHMLLGTINIYWNSMLRKHNAWDHRFDAPYGEPYR